MNPFLIFHSQLAINYTKQLKKTYFLLYLYTFVYKTKTANVAIKSDILSFLVYGSCDFFEKNKVAPSGGGFYRNSFF